MNRFKFLLTLAFAVVSCVSFVSCSKEEKEDLNHAAQIAGEYVGTIEISLYGETIEKSKGSKLVITRSSNDFVNATFYYANGDSVFENGRKITYEITKTSGGVYVLRSDDSTIEEIRINGKVAETNDSYIYINYDGYTYECDFEFEGSKQ
ncbi:MAG: hypothetical protein IKY82_05075 [Alistipes sp.]|nr:hypothetical protein [Alistipes sp.]